MRKSILLLSGLALNLACSDADSPKPLTEGMEGGSTTSGGSGNVAGNVGNAGSPQGGVPNSGAGGTSGSSTGGSGTAGAPPAGDGGATGNGGATGSGGAPGPGCVPNVACTLDPPATTGDIAQDCVNRINQFLVECACLPALERWTEGEACANQMAEYDSVQDTAHAGFRDDICNGGSGQNECPGHASNERVISRCLQSMWNEGPPPTDPCDGQCFQDYGHFINMTNPRHVRVACGFFTTPGGEVWAVQNFSR